MNFNMDPELMKLMEKTKESIVLREPVSLDGLYNLMEQDKARLPGEFKLEKGLLGASIVFDKYMNIGAKVSVKESTVTVSRTEQNKSVSRQQGGKNRMSFNQMSDFVQSTQSVINAVQTGEFGDDLTGGLNYFQSICDAMRELLQNRIK